MSSCLESPNVSETTVGWVKSQANIKCVYGIEESGREFVRYGCRRKSKIQCSSVSGNSSAPAYSRVKYSLLIYPIMHKQYNFFRLVARRKRYLCKLLDHDQLEQLELDTIMLHHPGSYYVLSIDSDCKLLRLRTDMVMITAVVRHLNLDCLQRLTSSHNPIVSNS